MRSIVIALADFADGHYASRVRRSHSDVEAERTRGRHGVGINTGTVRYIGVDER